MVVVPPLLYALVYFNPISGETASAANEILVHERFPRHADPQFGRIALFKLVWLIAGLAVARKNPKLFTIFTTVLVGSCTLTLVHVLLKSDALAILLPWRPFVLLVPISSALLVAASINAILSRAKWITLHQQVALFFCYSLMAVFFLIGVAFTPFETERRELPPRLLQYVSTNCSFGDTYLVPLDWEWFRLATRCPVFVDWKSHPYRDTEVLEWHKRVQLASAFYSTQNAESALALANIRGHAAITHIAAERGAEHLHLEYMKSLRLAFQDDEYLVYELNNQATRQIDAPE